MTAVDCAAVGIDDESTQEIDIATLRASLADARRSGPSVADELESGPELNPSLPEAIEGEPDLRTRMMITSSSRDVTTAGDAPEALESGELLDDEDDDDDDLVQDIDDEVEALEDDADEVDDVEAALAPLEEMEPDERTRMLDATPISVPVIVAEFDSDPGLARAAVAKTEGSGTAPTGDDDDLEPVELLDDDEANDDPFERTTPHAASELAAPPKPIEDAGDEERTRVGAIATSTPFGGAPARDTGTDELQPVDLSSLDQLTAAASAPPVAAPDRDALPREQTAFPDPDELPEAELPRFSLASTAEDDDVVELSTDDLVDRESKPDGELDAPAAPPSVDEARVDADELDPEAKELFESGRLDELVALYRRRLVLAKTDAAKVALRRTLARVQEVGLLAPNDAFETLLEAFALDPGDSEVVAAVDRIGKATGRIGEIAGRVADELLPRATEERRLALLAHLVYWYERVLGRGREVAPFVAEIERLDKAHPTVLRRAAEISAVNGDTRAQRDQLARALARTSRADERVVLHLALASAHADATDAALKHYEAALELEPRSLVALQGVKRLSRDKGRHDRVRWTLERQAEIAPTSAERIDALLELAELQETKFLKREAAAALLEKVLELEPGQPSALKALERCYHALRDWPKLVQVANVRAEHTYDPKTKIELLELAAEVSESKLGNLEGAIDACQRILRVEPNHRRAFGNLARLHEKLGDWANVATAKARLAELAPTKRASSQELVKLGEFLDTPERDAVAARIQYERAALVDPTNAAAWEALQRSAAAAGDTRRVVECLEQRAAHTEVPRQRAVILVELARLQRERGDEAAARRAFEEAIVLDPSNENAAIAMLDVFTETERWADASPLCELLVNAAVRDKDADALFVRLRLATRIAAALGDADRAVTAGIVALENRPNDPGAQADLIAVANQCRDSAPSLERARPHLFRIAEAPDELAADHLLRLSVLQRGFGDLDGAAATLERARRLDPDDDATKIALADVYLNQGDFARACKLKIDMARATTQGDTRFRLLCEAGEIWARRAGELEKAATVLEEARELVPFDSWLLQTMMWLYGELGQWERLTGVLEDMAQVHEIGPEKITSLLAMARVIVGKLLDRSRGADLYDQVLDIDRTRLDVFEEVVRVLTEDKSWDRLELSYRRMIARVQEDDVPQLQFLLFHQVGLIYRDRLGDAARAFDALDVAAQLRPDHVEVRRSVTELLVVTDNLDNAVLRIRGQIDREPHDPLLYEELYELFLRQHSFDKAWCAVSVLALLGAPSGEQRRFLEDYAPMPLDQVPGQIVEQAWRSHLLHEQLDPSLTRIFASIVPAAFRLRAGHLRPEERVSQAFTADHSVMHDFVRKTFDNASEILGVAVPELVVGFASAPVPFMPAVSPMGAVLVSSLAVEAQSGVLTYLIGEQLAEQRPELAMRALVPSVSELTAIVHSAVRVCRSDRATDAASAALDQSLAAALSPHEGASLRTAIAQATEQSASFDVGVWARAAASSSMRAGLLVAGDVEQAARAIGAAMAADPEAAREKLGELYKFATSDLHADLRGAIGVAVRG